jgi:hypothetical protein
MFTIFKKILDNYNKGVFLGMLDDGLAYFTHLQYLLNRLNMSLEDAQHA